MGSLRRATGDCDPFIFRKSIAKSILTLLVRVPGGDVGVGKTPSHLVSLGASSGTRIQNGRGFQVQSKVHGSGRTDILDSSTGGFNHLRRVCVTGQHVGIGLHMREQSQLFRLGALNVLDHHRSLHHTVPCATGGFFKSLFASPPSDQSTWHAAADREDRQWVFTRQADGFRKLPAVSSAKGDV